MDRETAVILTQSKSAGVSVLLTLVFGGLGLFYISTMAGLVMTVIEVILVGIAILTLGLGGLLLIPFHIICLIWSIVGVRRHNERLLETATQSAIQSG